MISLAYANSAPAPGGLMSFVPFIIIFILFYFMLIRPQMKQAKEHKKLLSELKKEMKSCLHLASLERSKK